MQYFLKKKNFKKAQIVKNKGIGDVVIVIRLNSQVFIEDKMNFFFYKIFI